MKLTEREIELIDGMIEVQLHHAQRCDSMQNAMAKKQKGWNLERVSLLEKIKNEGTLSASEIKEARIEGAKAGEFFRANASQP